MAHYRKSAKKVKNEVQERKNIVFGKLLFKICAFLCPVPSILTFSQFSQKCTSVYCISTLRVKTCVFVWFSKG